MESFKTFIPTKLFFGFGEINRLATEYMPGKRALIVISCGTSMKRLGYLNKVETLLAKNGVETVLFDKILPNPVKEHVMEGAQLCREQHCDFVVGLGGGSSIDSAKSIAIMAVNDGDYWDYMQGGSGGKKPVTKALPIIAIPTTAGTGTEVDLWTVITNGEEKLGFGCDFTYPKMAVVDPDFMMSVPAHLTAYQGFDAFFHSSEGYIANISTPISRIYSLKSIGLLYKYLPRAVENGNDREARYYVALASTLAGMVESTSSCISEHALEHAISGLFPRVTHGAGLIAISLAYFKMFEKDVPELYAEMANVMLERNDCDSEDFIKALARMQQYCKVDDLKMSEWGVQESDFSRFLENARTNSRRSFTLDPHPLTDAEILTIYKDSYK